MKASWIIVTKFCVARDDVFWQSGLQLSVPAVNESVTRYTEVIKLFVSYYSIRRLVIT